MALLPGSIMSLFGQKSAPASPAAGTSTTTAEPNVAAAQATSAAANPTTPSTSTPQSNGTPAAFPAAGTGDASPLANFKDLWSTDPKAPAPPSLVPTFNLDPKGLSEQAAKMNFTAHIDPAQVDKAMAGDKAAFLDVINKAAQFGFANAAAASGEIVKQSLTSASGTLQDSILPAAIRQQQINAAVSESNPVFSDPAVAPMLGMLKTQLASKYPTATPSEIAAYATQYLAGVSGKIVSANGGTVVTKEQQQQSQRNGFAPQVDQNWENYFGVA